MSKKKKKKITVIVYIVLLLVFVALVGAVAIFTNGFKNDFKSFYAVVDNKMILDSVGGYIVADNNPLSVDVKYTFGAFSKEQTGYSVKIVPNSNAKDFDFTVDGDVYSFKAEKDYTKGFKIDKQQNSFSVSLLGQGLLSVLQGVFPESVVELDSEVNFENLFTIVITSYDDSQNVYVSFGVENVIGVKGIVLDHSEIIL